MRLTQSLLSDKSRQKFRCSTQVDGIAEKEIEVSAIDKPREEIKTTIPNISTNTSGKGRIFLGKTMINSSGGMFLNYGRLDTIN